MTVRLVSYIVLNGTAQEAIRFYEKSLDAKIIGVQTFGESPSDPNHPLPESAKDLVMHAMLKIGESDLMFSDNFPGQPYTVGNHLSIALITSDANTARQYFDALQEGGKVGMPLQETFWSPAYGSLTDKFGITWQISTESKA